MYLSCENINNKTDIKKYKDFQYICYETDKLCQYHFTFTVPNNKIYQNGIYHGVIHKNKTKNTIKIEFLTVFKIFTHY